MPKPQAVLADKGYDSDDVRSSLLLKGILPVIPSKGSRKHPIPCDFVAYRDRNRVERMFNRLKHFRRIATRYDKTALSFRSFLNIAAAKIWLPSFVNRSYTPNNLKSHRDLVKHWGKVVRSLGYPIVMTQRMDITVSMHQCGTARFGNDPCSSVLDPYCKTWDVDNLYIVDASFLPSSAGFNPSLTIVAQAIRVAERIAAHNLLSTKAA